MEKENSAINDNASFLTGHLNSGMPYTKISIKVYFFKQN